VRTRAHQQLCCSNNSICIPLRSSKCKASITLTVLNVRFDQTVDSD
jgi:hypothetical protein